MNKILFAILLCFPITVFSQDFNLDDFTPITPAVVEDFEPIEFPVNDPDSLARFEEMKKIADEIKRIAEEIREHNLLKMSDPLEDRVTKLETDSVNWVTRDEVVEIVKEEVKKYVELTVQSNGISRKETINLVEDKAVATYNKVSIPGYTGTFDLAPGEVITHIEGVPVRNYSNSTPSSPMAYAGNNLMRASVSNKSWRVRVSQPNRCRVVNGRVVCN